MPGFTAATRLTAGAALMLLSSACSPREISAPDVPPVTPPPDPVTTYMDWFIWTPADGFKAMPRSYGFTRVFAYDVNSSGTVVGTRVIDSGGKRESHAFVWSESTGYKDILVAPNAIAVSIDDSGNVAGLFDAAGVTRPFTWSASGGLKELGSSVWLHISISNKWLALNAMKKLPNGGTSVVPTRISLAGNFEQELSIGTSEGRVLAINDNGEAAGLEGYEDNGFGGTSNAVVWDAQGRITTVYSCLGVNECFAQVRAINNNGIAAGDLHATGDIFNGYMVFRWSRADGLKSFALPPNPAAVVDPRVVDISDDGTVLVNNGLPVLVKPDDTLVPMNAPGYTFLNATAMSRNRIVVGNIPTPL